MKIIEQLRNVDQDEVTTLAILGNISWEIASKVTGKDNIALLTSLTPGRFRELQGPALVTFQRLTGEEVSTTPQMLAQLNHEYETYRNDILNSNERS